MPGAWLEICLILRVIWLAKKDKKEKTSKEKVVITSGRKKTAMARVRIKQGNGSFKVNGMPITTLKPNTARLVVSEPAVLAQDVLGPDFANNLDIDISTNGGGVMGQAYASRTALGKALISWSESEDLKKELALHVRKEIGAIAVPEAIQFAHALPKTRSGKIMRRILRKIAEGDVSNLGDITTLADPHVVEDLVKGRGK